MNDNDIQGNVVHAFNKPHQRFVMLRLPDDVDRARAWLDDVRGHVAASVKLVEHRKARKANPTKPPTKLWTGVSLTWTGLERLAVRDLDAALRDDYAFRAGALARAGDLGDVGRSAPGGWLFGAVDAVVTLAGDTTGQLDRGVADLTERAHAHGTEIVHVLAGDRPEDGLDHFGFKDGGAQPVLSGRGKDTKPGEIVIGEPSAAPERAIVPSWMVNASFQVLRVLAQDVRRWKAAADGQAEEWIGRRHDGQALPSTKPFSHVSKAHPAAEFEPQRRRLMRRGIPYGRHYEDDPSGERGLIFNAFMASIDRQYEYVQILWANRDDFPAPRTGTDRVIGAAAGRDGYRSVARYLTTRAAVYALTPGLDGLRELAGGAHRGGGGVLPEPVRPTSPSRR